MKITKELVDIIVNFCLEWSTIIIFYELCFDKNSLVILFCASCDLFGNFLSMNFYNLA